MFPWCWDTDPLANLCKALLISQRLTMVLSPQADFRNVEFRYARRPEVLALGGVSLALEPGRMVALVGLSGSGKSTLVSLLQRLYDPTAGRVRVNPLDG